MGEVLFSLFILFVAMLFYLFCKYAALALEELTHKMEQRSRK